MSPIQRALRTFAQAFIGTLLSLWAASGLDLADLDLSTGRRLLLSALGAAIVATLTWAHNALEDAGAVPKVGKS